MILFTAYYLPSIDFEKNPAEKRVLYLLEKTDDKFIILGPENVKIGEYQYKVTHNGIYSYAPIYHNLSSAGGWFPQAMNITYFKKLKGLSLSDNCHDLKMYLDELGVVYIIGVNEKCDFLERCGLEKVDDSEICLFKN